MKEISRTSSMEIMAVVSQFVIGFNKYDFPIDRICESGENEGNCVVFAKDGDEEYVRLLGSNVLVVCTPEIMHNVYRPSVSKPMFVVCRKAYEEVCNLIRDLCCVEK